MTRPRILDTPSQPQRNDSACSGKKFPYNKKCALVIINMANSKRLRLTTTDPTCRPLNVKKIEVKAQQKAAVIAANSPR